MHVDIRINVNNIPETLLNFGLSAENNHQKMPINYSQPLQVFEWNCPFGSRAAINYSGPQKVGHHSPESYQHQNGQFFQVQPAYCYSDTTTNDK